MQNRVESVGKICHPLYKKSNRDHKLWYYISHYAIHVGLKQVERAVSMPCKFIILLKSCVLIKIDNFWMLDVQSVKATKQEHKLAQLWIWGCGVKHAMLGQVESMAEFSSNGFNRLHTVCRPRCSVLFYDILQMARQYKRNPSGANVVQTQLYHSNIPLLKK